MQSSANKLSELQSIITKMPLEVFVAAALPDFGVRWKEVSKAVRKARLPMQPTSVARVLCRYVAKALSEAEVEDIVARLRLKLVATQRRIWHLIRLSEETRDEPVMNTIRALPGRLVQALRKNKKGMQPEVQTVLLGDLIYISMQLVSEYKEGSILFVAVPPGEPVALVSSTSMAGLLKAFVEGMGYIKYTNANLYGQDIKSLLRINNGSWNSNANHLDEIPEYAPIPIISKTGIDYTNKQYDENYVDSLLGANPPLLTNLNVKTSKEFFDRSRLNKVINVSISLKSPDIAKTLKYWVTKGALAPTSDFFTIISEMRANKITYAREDSD